MAEEQNQNQGQVQNSTQEQSPSKNIQSILNKYTVSEMKKKEKWIFPIGLNPLDNNKEKTEIIDIDKYWNFNNVVSPRIDVEFLEDIIKDKNGDAQAKWININKSNVEVVSFDKSIKSATNNNNYIVSMNITDNGSKELELVLYDRNFTDLQILIANSIQKINKTIYKDEAVSTMEVKGSDIGIDFLVSPQKVTANIRVRYGYNEDLNSKVSKSYSGLGKINRENDDGKYYRWRSSTSSEKINKLENATQEDLQDISSDTVLSHHYQQSTVLSEWEEFFIVGLTTSLTESGIKYNIKGISTSKMALDGYKMIQQYSKIVGKPKTILSTFMNMFNENDKSPIKLVWADKSVSASDSTINGEELIFDYESGKYILIDENKKEEMVENITIPINDISTYIKVLLDLKACFKRNPNNTISDYINGYDIEYNKNIGYIENNNMIVETNTQRKSFMDIAMLAFNKNEETAYNNVKNSEIVSNQYKLSCYIYTLQKIFNDLTNILKNKDSTLGADNKTIFYPIDVLKLWVASICLPTYEEIDDYSKIGEQIKILNGKKSSIDTYNSIYKTLTTVDGYKEAYMFQSNLCSFQVMIPYIDYDIYSDISNDDILLPRYDGFKVNTGIKDIKDINTACIFKNGSEITTFGNLTNFLSNNVSFCEKILNSDKDDQENKYENGTFELSSYKMNNFFIEKNKKAPLVETEKKAFNKTDGYNLRNLFDLDIYKSICDNINSQKKITTNNLIALEAQIKSVKDALNICKNKYSYNNIEGFRDNCFKAYENIIENIAFSFVDNNFAKTYIYDLKHNDSYIKSKGSTKIIDYSDYNKRYIYSTMKNVSFDKTEKAISVSNNDKKTREILIYIPKEYSDDNIKLISITESQKLNILLFINNLFSYITSFLNRNLNEDVKNKNIFKKIQFYNYKYDDSGSLQEEKYSADVLIEYYRLKDNFFNNFASEYYNFLYLQAENMLKNYEEKISNNKSLKTVKKEVSNINNKKNISDEIEKIHNSNLLSQVEEIESSINDKVNKSSIKKVFKKMAIKELKGEGNNNKTTKEIIESNNGENENSFEEFGNTKKYNILEKAFEMAKGTYQKSEIDSFLNDIDEKVEELNTTLQNLNKKLIKVNNSNVGKEIELSLGSRESVNTNAENRLTKTITSLLNDFCSQCQPKISILEKKFKMGEKDGKVLEEGTVINKPTMMDASSGEEKKIDIYDNIPRYNLTWGVIGKYIIDENEPYVPIVGLYYKEPIKVSKLRKYDWGPGNAKPHCIKNLSISNGSEFAMMHNFNTATIEDNNNMLISLTNTDKNSSKVIETTTIEEKMKNPGFFNQVLVSTRDKNVFNNLVNSVNQGNITLLGDPSLRFGGVIQPYTYPIYLNINLDRENSWYYNKQENRNEYYSEVSQLSGYYVITKITHNISTSGFTTTIEVMKYPGSNNIVK